MGGGSIRGVKAVAGSGNEGVTVSLFPNPGHGQFTLRVSGTSQTYSVSVTDMLGNVVRRIEGGGFYGCAGYKG